MPRETIVLGTRDLTPPEGRVTLELRSATTGRLRKKVRVENAVMDWYKEAVALNGGRGQFDIVGIDSFYNTPGVNPLGYAQSVFTLTPDTRPLAGLIRPGQWPTPYGVGLRFTNWLWATASDATPDATLHHIPTDAGVEVTAGVKIDTIAWVADGVQNKRGTPNLSLSAITWDQIRMVVDFASGEGNGIYRSVGIGSLINQKLSPGGLRPYCPAAFAATAPTVNTVASSSQTLASTYSYIAVGQSRIWALNNSFSMSRIDPNIGFNGTVEFTVAAMNLPGSGGPLGPVLVETPDDFWVARNQTLYRCVAPVADAAMTPVDTYSLAGTLGAETIQDITFDGTNLYLLTATKVYVVNPTTGASTSNWAHGLTAGTDGYASMSYDSTEQLLWINFPDRTTLTGTSEWGDATSVTSVALNYDTLICYGFPVAGTSPTKWTMGRHTGSGGSAQQPHRQITGMSPDGRFLFRLGNDSSIAPNNFLAGPSMATHALLPGDVEKTSDDTLRIIYDFNFS